MHEYIGDICELKMRALEELAEFGRRGEFSRNELPTIDMLAHTAKNLCKVLEMCEEKTGYSFGTRVNTRGSYSFRDGYSNEGQSGRGGYSGARRRDSMGRYSGAYSGTYSGDDDWMMNTLQELKNNAPNDQMRMEFDEFISRMQRMK